MRCRRGVPGGPGPPRRLRGGRGRRGGGPGHHPRTAPGRDRGRSGLRQPLDEGPAEIGRPLRGPNGPDRGARRVRSGNGVPPTSAGLRRPAHRAGRRGGGRGPGRNRRPRVRTPPPPPPPRPCDRATPPKGSSLTVPPTPMGATSMRTHLCGALRAADIGSTVTVCGWVAKRREHGEHLAFIDLRDHTGIVQCVIPGTVDARSEYVISVQGAVRARPEGTLNPDLPTGEVEIGDCIVTILNSAEPPPFAIDDRVEVDEGIRLKHRF